jgi:hypothetical protein
MFPTGLPSGNQWRLVIPVVTRGVPVVTSCVPVVNSGVPVVPTRWDVVKAVSITNGYSIVEMILKLLGTKGLN